jgi:CrcB protein
MVLRLLAVALGGSLGAVSRYLLAAWIGRWAQHSPFPFGTLGVNVLGSFLLGLLLGTSLSGSLPVQGNTKALCGIGFLGAFTTFSTFSFETLQAFEAGAPGMAMANVALNVSLSLAACWLGLLLATRL